MSSCSPDLTGGEWRCKKEKRQKTDMQKVGARCAGCSDGDAQQPHCFFSLITPLLLCFFSSLFFKVLLLHYSLKLCFFSIFYNLTSKVFLLFCSLKSLSLHLLYPTFSLVSLKVLALRLALSHVPFSFSLA
jgi:hypothetical protein